MGRPVLSPKLSRGTFSPTSEYSSQAGLHTQGEPGAAHWLSPEVSVTPPMAHGTAASSLPRRRLCAVLLAWDPPSPGLQAALSAAPLPQAALLTRGRSEHESQISVGMRNRILENSISDSSAG